MVDQVGGTHYNKSYDHWDWVMDTRVFYLLGNATKYVFRHSKKNGEDDIRKAISYFQKAEQYPLMDLMITNRNEMASRSACTTLFANSPHLGLPEQDILTQSTLVKSHEDLTHLSHLCNLILLNQYGA